MGWVENEGFTFQFMSMWNVLWRGWPVNLDAIFGLLRVYPMFQESQVWSRRLSTKMFFYLSRFRARTVQWSKGMQTNQQVHKLHDMIFCFELSSGFHRQHHPHGSMLSLDFSFSLQASSPWIYVFFDLRHIRYIGGMPAAMHAGASACRLQPVMTCPTRPLSGIIPRAHRVTWCVSELGIAKPT